MSILYDEVIDMKGILTNCFDWTEKEIELEYEIRKDDNDRQIFYLLNGVTGYESFFIDAHDINLPKFINGRFLDDTVGKMCKSGWYACAGTKNKYDKLYILAEEMKKVFIAEGLI